VPPAVYCEGKVTFGVALVFIGFVTAIIGDLATLFGCVMGLEPSVTAITFVALGTSLPDTFASKAATIGDDTADAAIGNVTGSNSVNVFLGLGMPWLLAAIYWELTGVNQAWEDAYGVAVAGDKWQVTRTNDNSCGRVGLITDLYEWEVVHIHTCHRARRTKGSSSSRRAASASRSPSSPSARSRAS